mmetsp:Transcript_2754/g.3996  ORF Transcript_2754/g.3996 Transcript_2754/m.3996 type:complete len:205 (+) Transcript_2754:360-974(+)
MRHPCNKEKDVLRRNSTLNGPARGTAGSTRIPSPLPSVKRDPTLVPICKANSLLSSVSVLKWWITGVEISSALRISNTLLEPYREEISGSGHNKTMAGSRFFTFLIASSSSVPSTVTANRIAPSGNSPFLAIASSRVMRATALGIGSFSNSLAGTITPMETSMRRRRAVLAAVSDDGGTVRRRIESDVAISLKGIPTAVLQPNS